MSHIRKRKTNNGYIWELVVEAGRRQDGSRIQKYKRLEPGVTEKEAQKALLEFEKSIQDGTYLEPNRKTLKEWLDEWMECCQKPNSSPTTVAGYKHKIDAYICAKKGGIGHIPIQKLTPMTIQVFINKLLAHSPSTGKALSPKTVKETYNILNASLKSAVLMKVIDENPAEHIRLPKRDKPEIKVLPLDEMDILLKWLKKEKSDIELPVNLALSMGLRRGEVLGLKFSDVDYEKGTISIRNTRVQCCDATIVEKNPKSKKSVRTLYMPETIMKMIKRQENRCRLTQMRKKKYNKGGYVCYMEEDGKPWIPDSLSKKYAKVIENLGLTHVTFHGLRHCFASICLHEGVDIMEISKLLGHASASFTLDTYVHLLQDRSDIIAQAMNNILYKRKVG